MSQDDVRTLMNAAAGGRHAVHNCLAEILGGIEGTERRLKLAELNAELASENVDVFRFSDRIMVASVIRQNRGRES